MLRRFILCVLVLSRIAVGDTSSNSSQELKVQHGNSKENLSEGESPELLNARNGSSDLLSTKGKYYSEKIKDEDKLVNILNNVSMLSAPENVPDGDVNTKSEDFSENEKSEDNTYVQSKEQLDDGYRKNYSQGSDFLSPFHDVPSYFDPDYWLQINVSDRYDPQRTKKNKPLHKKDELVKSSGLKSSDNFMKPTIRPLRTNEKNALMSKVDYLLERNMKNSNKHAGGVERNGLFYLEGHKSNNSELPSESRFLNYDISSTSVLTEPAKVDVGQVFKYHPSANSKLRNNLYVSNDKDKVNQLKYLDNHKTPSHQGLQEFDEGMPTTLNEAEDRRQVTVLKQKTVHSVSKEEEQETVNIHQHPVERLLQGNVVAIGTHSNNKELQKPEKQEKIEKREETIVLVEGTHIPGKNYGPEDDLFGYYTDSYENLQPASKDNQKIEITLSNGPSVQSSHKVRQNNHGDGLSARYFVNKPKSSGNSNPTKFKENVRFVFPPSNSPPRVTHELHEVSIAERGKSRNLPETYRNSHTIAKHQENGNSGQTSENAQDTRHKDDNQYVLADVDPNQIYIDEKTGQLIKFVTEEEAQKLGVTAQYQGENGQDEHSATYSQKKPDQNSHPGLLENFSTSHVTKGQALDSKIFVNGGGSKEYSELTNVDLDAHLQANKPRKGMKSQYFAVNEKSPQFHVPMKDIKSKSHSVSYSGIHGVQEDQGSYYVPGNSEGNRGKTPEYVEVNGKINQFYVPGKDKAAKSNFHSVSDESSHGVQEDQGSYYVSGNSEGNRGKTPEFVEVNGKINQFYVPGKDIAAKSNFRSISDESSHGVRKDQGNYDASSHSGGTIGTEYVVLCPETGNLVQNNQDYGKKLNFDSLGGTVTNSQGSKDDYHQNNFKGSEGKSIEYDDVNGYQTSNDGNGYQTSNDGNGYQTSNDGNGYQTSNDGLNHSENEGTYTEDNFETHGGNLGNTGNFKGSTEGLHNIPVHGLLYNAQTDGKSVNTENIGNFKGTSGGLEDAQGQGVLYELQAGGKSTKTDNTEMPLYKENMQAYRKETESSLPSFPSKGDAVSTVYFTMVHHKAKSSRNPKRKKQNQNNIEFETPKNNFKGISQKQNGGFDMNSIHDHENYRISLQNLYGHNTGSLSFGKSQGTNYQNSGNSKGNDNYLLPTGVNFKGKQLYEEVNLSSPQSSVKGSSQSYKGNNMKSGLNLQNSRKPSSGYSSGFAGSGKGKNGGYNSNGITYSSQNGNSQPNSHHMLQNQYATLNNVHQSEGPVEYVIVEEDDNNYESKTRTEERKKQNQNYIEFATPNNNFKGIRQKQTGGLDMNSIHNHENFRTSLQTLFGHNSGSLSIGKSQGTNYQNSGNSKGNDNFLLPTGVNFKGKQVYEEVNLSSPQSSVKGSSQRYKGNNMKSGLNLQNSRKPSSGYSSGFAGSGKGKNGGYNSNGITYSSQNRNLQPNSHHMLQNQFAALNNAHQSEGPVEYVIVEEDDNNYESKIITEDPFLLEYEKYKKGNNGGLTSTNGLGYQPYVVKGSTTYSMDPNVRLIVDGGKDTASRLGRLAATGFHMARGVLPYFPIPSGPRSVKGNVNFGLQINKRRGPAIISHFL